MSRCVTQSSGIAIGPILFVIAMLAVLVGAISSGSGGFGSSTSPERAKLLAAQIINQAQQVKNAVERVRSKGCSDEEISFENGVMTGYVNPNSPVATKPWCHVFQPQGGGTTWQRLPMNFVTHFIFDSNVSVAGHGADKAELVVFFGLGNVSSGFLLELCRSLNDLMGVENPSNGTAPLDAWSNGLKFTGSYNDTSPSLIGDGYPGVSRKFGACVRTSATNASPYFVLISR